MPLASPVTDLGSVGQPPEFRLQLAQSRAQIAFVGVYDAAGRPRQLAGKSLKKTCGQTGMRIQMLRSEGVQTDRGNPDLLALDPRVDVLANCEQQVRQSGVAAREYRRSGGIVQTLHRDNRVKGTGQPVEGSRQFFFGFHRTQNLETQSGERPRAL